MINANPQQFMDLLEEEGEEGEEAAPPGVQYVQVTAEEQAAIQRVLSRSWFLAGGYGVSPPGSNRGLFGMWQEWGVGSKLPFWPHAGLR